MWFLLEKSCHEIETKISKITFCYLVEKAIFAESYFTFFLSNKEDRSVFLSFLFFSFRCFSLFYFTSFSLNFRATNGVQGTKSYTLILFLNLVRQTLTFLFFSITRNSPSWLVCGIDNIELISLFLNFFQHIK